MAAVVVAAGAAVAEQQCDWREPRGHEKPTMPQPELRQRHKKTPMPVFMIAATDIVFSAVAAAPLPPEGPASGLPLFGVADQLLLSVAAVGARSLTILQQQQRQHAPHQKRTS